MSLIDMTAAFSNVELSIDRQTAEACHTSHSTNDHPNSSEHVLFPPHKVKATDLLSNPNAATTEQKEKEEMC